MDPQDSLLLAALVALALWGWYQALAARERAMAKVRALCVELRLQILDQTVTLRELWPCRGAHGGLALRRVYGFEFSTGGADRRSGRLCYIGADLQWARLDHPDGPIVITS